MELHCKRGWISEMNVERWMHQLNTRPNSIIVTYRLFDVLYKHSNLQYNPHKSFELNCTTTGGLDESSVHYVSLQIRHRPWNTGPRLSSCKSEHLHHPFLTWRRFIPSLFLVFIDFVIVWTNYMNLLIEEHSNTRHRAWNIDDKQTFKWRHRNQIW